MLKDGDLRKKIERVVRGSVPDADVEDVVQETLWAAYQAKGLPKDKTQHNRYVFGTARNKVADCQRGALRTPRVKDGENVDDVAPRAFTDMVAERDMLTRLESEVPVGQLVTWRCLARHLLLEEDVAEIAREVGIPYPTLYKRVTTLRRRLRQRVTALAGVAVLLVVFVSTWKVLRRESEPVAGPPPRAPRAEELRSDAFQECVHNQWIACLMDLDGAKTLDPAGDADPLVQAARTDAADGIRHEGDKSGSGWTPPKIRPYAGAAAQ